MCYKQFMLEGHQFFWAGYTLKDFSYSSKDCKRGSRRKQRVKKSESKNGSSTNVLASWGAGGRALWAQGTPE